MVYSIYHSLLVYFYSHYFFASLVAHIGSMYSAFLVLMVALGAPPVISALTLGFFSNLMGGLTHYGCGQHQFTLVLAI